VSNSILFSLLFSHSASFRRNRVAREADLTEEFPKELYSILISPRLFLASYIWAVDIALRDGLENLGKDDAGEGKSGKQSHACSSSSHAFFFLMRVHGFFFRDRSLTVTRLPMKPLSFVLICQTRDAR